MKYHFGRRTILIGIVISAHILLIFGPIGYFMLKKSLSKPDEIAFRVKLGGLEPSHAPLVGEPERKRPTPDAGNVPPPPDDPEPLPPPPKKTEKPSIPPPPKKDDAAEKLKQRKAAEARKKRIAEKKRKAAEARKKELAEKKRREQQKQRRIEREKERQRRIAREKARQRRIAEAKRKAAEARKKASESVYHDSRWDNWDPNKPASAPGGKNFNRNVKIGQNDRGQRRGKVDGRTPAGGATADMEKYWSHIKTFFMEKWQPPAGVFVDERTAVQITIQADASGRVTGKWISKRSPNAAVNSSAELLLKNLSYIPKSPEGATRFTLSLVQDH